MSNAKLKLLVTIPSGFCFGLQEISIKLFAKAGEQINAHFLVTRWNDGEFTKMLDRYGFHYSYSWLGMFSRKLDRRNLQMSIHTLTKLPRLYIDFVRLCKRTKPDILFFANHHELILLLPVLWFTRIKVVCHMHDPSVPIPFQKFTFRWYSRSVDLFIAISHDVKKRLVELGCKEDKISVVHNGVELPINPPRQRNTTFVDKFSWPVNSFILGITGQMTSTKGHEDLVAAVAVALEQDPRVRLIIGGKKLEPLFGALMKLIEARNLQDIVAFSDWVENVGDFYEAIDVFVLASRHDEGYGLVVAESMAYGKPVIITRSGGATEIVEDGRSGFIVPKQNPDTLAEKILTLSSNEDILAQFRIAARARIEREFSIQLASDRFITQLRTVE